MAEERDVVESSSIATATVAIEEKGAGGEKKTTGADSAAAAAAAVVVVGNNNNKQQTQQKTKKKKKKKKKKGDHVLQTEWSFWFEKKDRSSATTPPTSSSAPSLKEDAAEYRSKEGGGEEEAEDDGMVQIGSFNTIEKFWGHYVHMQKASELPVDSNIYLFRKDLEPVQESFPFGGCFIMKVKRRPGLVGQLWQDLVFAMIGERFEDPTVVGAVLAVRGDIDILSVWVSATGISCVAIGEKLKQALHLEEGTTLDFTVFRDTIKTASLLRRQQNSAEDGKGAPAEVTEEDADATAGDAKRQEKGE